MEQYISKAAVLAELERRKSQFISQAESFREIGRKEQENYFAALASNMNSLSCFIDTLEVKEIDLEKEILNKELADEIDAISKRYPEVSFAKLSRIAVRIARWQKEQDKKGE